MWHFDFGTTLEANQHSILPRKSLIEEDLWWVTDVGWVGADSAGLNLPSPCPLRVLLTESLSSPIVPVQAKSRPVRASPAGLATLEPLCAQRTQLNC